MICKVGDEVDAINSKKIVEIQPRVVILKDITGLEYLLRLDRGVQNEFLIIIVAMVVFSIGTNMPAYAQMPKAAGSDLMEQPLATVDSAQDTQVKEAVSPVEEPVMKIECLDNQSQVYSFELKDAQIRIFFGYWLTTINLTCWWIMRWREK